MNIKTRLTKLEATIDPNVCLVCGSTLPSVAEAGAQIEALLPEYEQAGCTREQALHWMPADAPMLMRRIGLLPVAPAGHCAGCGTDLRPAEESARELLAIYVKAYGGDQEGVLRALRADAPELVIYLQEGKIWP